MSSPESTRLHAFVYGMVQGVNFRYYTSRHAAQLGVTGWVRNRPEGTVEVIAEGPKPKLEGLLTWLHRGPPSAYVERVEATWQAGTGEFSGFRIRYS
jgi:acylphosphatase